MILPFAKYQGTGNDFIIIDNRNLSLEHILNIETIRFLCDRRFGIGADGLMLLSPSTEYDFQMIYYNADGSESTLCGNGSRCIVAFAHRLGLIGETCTFEAIDGPHNAWYTPTGVRLEMNPAKGYRQLSSHEFWLDSGSPHYVRYLTDSVHDLDLDTVALPIRHDAAYAAIGGTNVNFARELAPLQLEVRTFERGVEGETLSCGTGVTACAYAYLQGIQQGDTPSEEVLLDTPGGKLSVRVAQIGTDAEEVYLSGPATFVFEGTIDLSITLNQRGGTSESNIIPG